MRSLTVVWCAGNFREERDACFASRPDAGVRTREFRKENARQPVR